MSFGRKGATGGAAAIPARPAFGAARPQAPVEDVVDPYAAQRAAFLASERVRKAESGPSQTPHAHDVSPSYAPSSPVYIREKSMGMAYLLWFILGQLSAHRFYAGATSSAVIQASMFVVGWMLVLSGILGAFFVVVAGGIWVLADAFMIPGLIREANRKARERSVHHAFA